MNNKITVADIIRTAAPNTYVKLVHTEEDDMRYINSEITESATAELFAKAYGYHKMSSWMVDKIDVEPKGDEAFVRIFYSENK